MDSRHRVPTHPECDAFLDIWRTTSFLSPAELHQNVERLWKLDTLPFRNSKEVICSGEDKAAMKQLERKTMRVTADGVSRYAAPLLHKPNTPTLHAPPLVEMALLRSRERCLASSAEQSAVYNEGYTQIGECWIRCQDQR